MALSKKKIWLIWLLMTAVAATYLGFALAGKRQTMFLPGATTDGHYQIELKCEQCHGDSFEGGPALQKACVRCHGDELNAVEDSHPRKKFTDPRNAERVAKLDAKLCVTCHSEHRPKHTREMGVTLADDFCVYCHADIEEDRKSHKDFPFDGCAAGGCHNFHDNEALYEDFLVKHADKPDLLPQPQVRSRDFGQFYKRVIEPSAAPLSAGDNDGPRWKPPEPAIVEQWAASGHAASGVNCTGCHAKSETSNDWVDQPKPDVCARCHEAEGNGFRAGKHGMRLAAEIGPMSPQLARLPMKDDGKDKPLGCNSCHGSHKYDTKKAAVEACLGCHDDEHSNAYKKSPHYKLIEKVADQAAPAESSVTCATCHLPRVPHKQEGERRVLVQHNQNFNLEPNEKMIRSVCMSCHGLRFSIDALADPALIANNFRGQPSKHIESIDMAVLREKSGEKDKDKKKQRRDEDQS